MIFVALAAALVVGIALFVTAVLLMNHRQTLMAKNPGKKYVGLLLGEITAAVPGVALPILSVISMILFGSVSACLNAYTEYSSGNRTIYEHDPEDAPNGIVKYIDSNGNSKEFAVQYDEDGNRYLVEMTDKLENEHFGVFPNN